MFTQPQGYVCHERRSKAIPSEHLHAVKTASTKQVTFSFVDNKGPNLIPIFMRGQRLRNPRSLLRSSMETIAIFKQAVLVHKQLNPAHNRVPPVGAPHILSRMFFFGKEKRKLLFKGTQREQHSGAAPLYTNEDLQLRLEKKKTSWSWNTNKIYPD